MPASKQNFSSDDDGFQSESEMNQIKLRDEYDNRNGDQTIGITFHFVAAHFCAT